MPLGPLFTAFTFGLRHGVDWDHIAAIADLTSGSESRKRGFVLSLWYAIGHAIVVLILGAFVIAIEATIPESLDVWMGRVVGATLLFLGVWVLVDLRRSGDEFRLRSRWMLVLGGTFAGLRRVRRRGNSRAIEVDHDHDHGHVAEGLAHDSGPAHDHAHLAIDDELVVPALDDVAAGSVGATSHPGGFSEAEPQVHAHSASHRHSHRHRLDLPTDASNGSGIGMASGIGMLHGVGIESPTQIAVFVASTSADGRVAGFGMLVAWCIGLVLANAGLAIAAGMGLLNPRTNATIYRALAVVVALASIALGLYYLLG
ncbi:MAG: hypothetical protein AAF567_09810 [Actinomycetota bacterium]